MGICNQSQQEPLPSQTSSSPLSTETFFFTHPYEELKNSIVSYSEASGVKLLTQQALDFCGWASVRVSKN